LFVVKAIQFEVCVKGETMSQESINFSIVVNPPTQPPPALTVVDGSGNPITDGADITLQPETVGVADPGQTLFTVSGGVPPYSFVLESGAYPDGDVASSQENADGSETVVLEGTPTTAETSDFAITVSDSAGNTVIVNAKKKKPIA
jgi:hypothetical protein